MSLPAIASISDCANMIAEQCALWVEPLGGTVKVMANIRHLWEEVYSASTTDKPKVLVVFNRERSRGSEQLRNYLHRVDRNWLVVIMRGHGFENRMPKTDTDTDDFYSACETLRDRIRVIVSISEENPLDYVGMGPLPGVAVPGTANVFLDAYQIEFNTANDIAAVVMEAPDTVN
jgi:hypothetical protein